MDREKIELFKKNIHAQMMGISRQLNQSSDDEERYVRQNRVLMEYCIDFRRPFYKCARIVNEKYGYDLNEYDIEDILRKSGIRGVSRREEILNWADWRKYLKRPCLMAGQKILRSSRNGASILFLMAGGSLIAYRSASAA